MKKIEKIYKDQFLNFFKTESIFYQFIAHECYPMGNYRKKVKDGDYKKFIEDISKIDTKYKTYYKYFKNYIENHIENSLKLLQNGYYKVIHISDIDYPERLKKLEHPPQFIYYKGELNKILRSVAIVGTRDIDKLGVNLTTYFVKKIIQNGINVVSGSAKGVDQLAQDESLKNGGGVIIVSGVGLEHYFNTTVGKEYLKLDEKTLFLTEFPPFFKGNKQSFPIRNRIIAALALGTIVIQAPEKSGSLYTANYSLSIDKPVMVPPGDIFSKNFMGSHNLLKKRDKNIHFITDIEDILKILSLSKNFEERDLSSLDSDMKKIYKIIENSYPERLHYDKIFDKVEISNDRFQVKLLQLIMFDLIKEYSGKFYSI